MPDILASTARIVRFRDTYGLRVLIHMEPIAGACQVGLAVAVGQCRPGGFSQPVPPEEQWARAFRDGSNGGFQGNLLSRSATKTQRKKRGMREFFGRWRSAVAKEAAARRGRISRSAATRCLRRGRGWYRRLWGCPAEFDAACKNAGVASFSCATPLAEFRADGTRRRRCHRHTGCQGRRAWRRVW